MSHLEDRDTLRQFPIQMGAKGRLVLPARVRESLDLHEGDHLVLTVEEDGSLRLVSVRGQIAKLRGMLSDMAPEHNFVDELIAERRTESKGEASLGLSIETVRDR